MTLQIYDLQEVIGETIYVGRFSQNFRDSLGIQISGYELHLTLTYLVSGIAIKVLKLRKRLSGKIHV